MVGLDDIAAAFGFDAKADADWTTLGKVTAVNQDGTLSVLLGGSATPTTCAAYCVASAGDIVFVAVSKGKARAIARQGGDAGSVIWGGIGGTLSNQTDLQNALNAKADASALPKFDLIYDTPLYWWDGGAITGTDSGADDPSRAGMGYGELTASIEDYDFLIIHFKAGDTNSLNNTRLTHTLPVGAVEYLTGAQIDGGTKAQEFVYLYPAANPSWYIDVAYGFTDALHVYAKRRTYGNLRYWNIDKIYGLKL